MFMPSSVQNWTIGISILDLDRIMLRGRTPDPGALPDQHKTDVYLSKRCQIRRVSNKRDKGG